MSNGLDRAAASGRPGIVRPVLEARSRILQAIRRFFLRRRFLEVETPVRIPSPALESHIDAIPSADQYLRTSPELHMKRLVAAGHHRIFQMGPCFRHGEKGDLHNPEFTMLEWYRSPGGYLEVLRDAEGLIPFVARQAVGPSVTFRGQAVNLSLPWERMAVADAFRRFAGWDPVADFDEDRFDLDLVQKVEPALPKDRPVVLLDYPIAVGALARAKTGVPGVAERWEVYVGGVELANAFTELADAAEQRQRFEQCARERAARHRPVYAVDETFLSALERGMPPCGGVALGVDRLVMILTGSSNLDAVLPFRNDAAPDSSV